MTTTTSTKTGIFHSASSSSPRRRSTTPFHPSRHSSLATNENRNSTRTEPLYPSSAKTTTSTFQMILSPAQRNLIERLETNPDTGLSTDQVTARREETGTFNVVKPPIDCPPTVCCLLPCIKHIPSMKAFRALQPDEAEVMRNGAWIRYDVTSLVVGDIIRLEEGDMVPADCVVLDLTTPLQSNQELLVDVRGITAEEKPRSAKRIPRQANKSEQEQTNEATYAVQPVQLYWGGTVVQGGCIAVVTAIGCNCYISTLIASGKFPPPPNVMHELADTEPNDNDDNDEDAAGVSLVQAQRREEPMLREPV